MTTLLLLITEPIPNPLFDETNNYLNRILFHINNEGRKCQAINLREITAVLRYRKQKLDYFKNDHDEGIEKLNSDLGEELTNVILDGKCKLIILVDSPGGYNGYARSIIDFILNLRSNGGETISFSFYSTSSAAFMIVSAVEKRYALLESEFMYHRGNLREDDEIDNEDDEITDPDFDETTLQHDFDLQDMEETYDRFFNNSDEESHDECISLKEKCIENINYDAYFSGEHLMTLGSLTDCALSSEELVKWVNEHLGLIPKEGTELSRILNDLESNGNYAINHGLFKSVNKGIFDESESPIFINPENGSKLRE